MTPSIHASESQFLAAAESAVPLAEATLTMASTAGERRVLSGSQ
jgi:hypothetical protein